jgi:hypothetical protein
MNLKALVGAAALSALVLSGGVVAYAQDAAPSGPGTMAPIPNPPEKPKASHHGKHMKKHAKHHVAAKHHMAAKKAKAKADAAPAK